MSYRFIALALLFAVVGGACASSGSAPSSVTSPTVHAPRVDAGWSVVTLGDSVASGEGIDYGYVYDPTRLFPHWKGPADKDPRWEPPLQVCHESLDAYGNVIGEWLGGKTTAFACTGAGFDDGIAAPQTHGDTTTPAQFGNWAKQTDLNAEYDAAAPDLVLVTFGADDVRFAGIVTYCVAASVIPVEVMNDAIKDAGDLPEGMRKVLGVNKGEFKSFLEDVEHEPSSQADKRSCTADDPGFAIDTFYWNKIGELTDQYRELAGWIKARGARDGTVPEVVFTTYHDPFPKNVTDESFVSCPDLGNLQADQVAYLSQLLSRLRESILEGLKGVNGVHVVDIRDVLDGHRWCSDDPWAYGMTTLLGDTSSQAPFHPTPRGQAAIAEEVWKVVEPRAR